MSAEQRDVVKPVHVTKGETASAVASGLLLGVGIVAAAPYIVLGGGLIGLGMGLHVSFREGYEKARQKSELEEQGDIVSK